MPAFRERPLTWLFLVATACLDAVAVAANFQVVWFDYLVAGQLFVAGGWLALGKAHRLARAGVALGVTLALTAPDYLVPGRHGIEVWRYVMASLTYLTAATAIAAWCTMGLVERWRPADRHRPARRWNFPLAEIFGWTIIVAVLTLMAKSALYTHLDDRSSHYVIFGAGAAVAGWMMTLLLWRPPSRALPSRELPSLVAAAAAVVAYWGVLKWQYPAGGYPSFWDAYAYVAAWIFVQRLDAAMVANRTTIRLAEFGGDGFTASHPH